MKFQVNGQEFSIPPAYHPGHRLTQAEAQALEGLRLEKLRGALKGRRGLSQAEVEAFAERWTFEPKPAGWREGELEKEARGLAELRVGAETGLMPGDLGWEGAVAQAMLDPQLKQEARERVEARREILRRELDALVA